VSAFPDVIHECITGYYYNVNEELYDITNENSFMLNRIYSDPETCAMNILYIRPIVLVSTRSTVLNNVKLTGPLCNEGDETVIFLLYYNFCKGNNSITIYYK